MKSIVKEKKVIKDKPFPKLMKGSQGQIVFMFGTGRSSATLEGVVIANDVMHQKVGYHSATWAANCFEDFHGSVTLES